VLILCLLPNGSMDAMNEASIGFDLNEEAILAYEVSDEELEAPPRARGRRTSKPLRLLCARDKLSVLSE
jgi:hypothetical protein